MRVRLFWEKSWYNDNKDSFWVECTENEVIENILPYRSDEDFIEKIKQNKRHPEINLNTNEKIYCYFFLISKDLEFIESFNWVYPYSGMWNAYNPFVEIEPIDIIDLEELTKINVKIKNA